MKQIYFSGLCFSVFFCVVTRNDLIPHLSCYSGKLKRRGHKNIAGGEKRFQLNESVSNKHNVSISCVEKENPSAEVMSSIVHF